MCDPNPPKSQRACDRCRVESAHIVHGRHFHATSFKTGDNQMHKTPQHMQHSMMSMNDMCLLSLSFCGQRRSCSVIEVLSGARSKERRGKCSYRVVRGSCPVDLPSSCDALQRRDAVAPRVSCPLGRSWRGRSSYRLAFVLVGHVSTFTKAETVVASDGIDRLCAIFRTNCKCRPQSKTHLSASTLIPVKRMHRIS